jgi:acetyl-CoA synthetase
MGKVVLSLLPDQARQRYAQRGLKAFTAATITTPAQLLAELVDVRRQGYAVEREEFTSDFCCVAAPILDDGGRFAATVGVSASTRAFDAEHEHLVEVVRDVASRHVPKRHSFLHRVTVSRTTYVAQQQT